MFIKVRCAVGVIILPPSQVYDRLECLKDTSEMINGFAVSADARGRVVFMINDARRHPVSGLILFKSEILSLLLPLLSPRGRFRRGAGIKRLGAAVSLALCLLAGGCASIKLGEGSQPPSARGGPVKLSGPARLAEPLRGRAILGEAVESLTEVPWQKPEPVTLRMRVGHLFSGKGAAGQPRRELNDCTADYVARLIRYEDPVGRLEQDVATALGKAMAVAEAGHQAVDVAKPLKSDVTLLEQAMSEIRLARSIVAGTAKGLEARGFSVNDKATYFNAFSQTIEDVSKTADLVAARAFRADTLEVAEKDPLQAAPSTDVR